jgi:YD repeat-containing protein
MKIPGIKNSKQKKRSEGEKNSTHEEVHIISYEYNGSGRKESREQIGGGRRSF